MSNTGLEHTLFGVQLVPELEAFLADTNPWWTGRLMRPLPSFRRWLFEPTLQRLKAGLGPVTVLRGPRQVGKTTLQEHIIDHLLHQEGVHPNRIFRVQFDEIPSLKGLRDPILSLCRWFEGRILGGSFNEWARGDLPPLIPLNGLKALKARDFWETLGRAWPPPSGGARKGIWGLFWTRRLSDSPGPNRPPVGRSG